MRKRITQILFLSYAILMAVSIRSAVAGDGDFHPDSLQTVTISGTSIVDSSLGRVMYYLDSNNDGKVDFKLNFGPWWYKPDSSTATRPNDGEKITIKGGVEENDNLQIPMLVVYEINGEFWRNPVEPTWNMMGGHQSEMGHHNGMGFAFGWLHDSLQTVNVQGVILIDTTFIYANYYLDTNADQSPDYLLNFGPPWYQPDNGIERPKNGDSIRLTGGLLKNHALPMLIVYTLNDLVWRDSSSLGKNFAGRWIYSNMENGRYVHSPFDTLDRMFVYPGWKGGNGHGHNGMMQDSLFAQILEVFPQNIPNANKNHVLAGYEIALFNPDGSNNMWMNGMNGGHMNMESNVDFTLHYTDIQLQGQRINESTIQAKYWDDNLQDWVILTNALVDPENNTVSFSSQEVSNYVILSGQLSPTGLDEGKGTALKEFDLKQNYPNPFNPTTTIVYRLKNPAKVNLTVYNGLGQKIGILVNGYQNSGEHRLAFDGRKFASGVYYYALNVNGHTLIRKMTLIK